ncbi:hypothetical protein [Paraliomyxa miuraensis]|uniref:hypothetical protein n=1 Tax=Paraliomyxa miuraensis TaxID=376150 RepID=UPI00224F76ED|nr:hypothetical protein [Paraliomyxa miuraensis]MCX4244025.1 hypothetical protein [Paraliomyxa miuraensis]
MMRRWLLVAGVLLACRAEPTTTPDPGPEPAAAPVARPSPAIEPEPEPEPSSELLEELVEAPPPYTNPAEGWPAELPWVSDADLSYAEVQVSQAGDVRVRWSAPTARLQEVGTRLQQGLVQAGYTASEPCELRPGEGCRLRLGDRLVVLSAGITYPGSETINVTLQLLPAGHRPLARLPGRCVVPPSRKDTVIVSASGIDQEGEARYAESRWSVDTAPGPDLDGDGVPEVYVPRESKEPCPWNVPHDVYVMRGSCGHRVGTIVGPVDDETNVAPFVKGLRAIHTSAEWAAFDGDFGVPNHHTRTRRYEFDGSKLRKRAEDEREGKCHHCGVEHCRRR